MSTKINVKRRRGDTKREIFYIYNSNKVIVDISSGYSFLMTCDPEKDPTDDTNNLFQIAGVVIDGPAGKVGFPFTLSDSDQTPGKYYYDIQVIDPNSEKFTIIDGSMKFTQDITKD